MTNIAELVEYVLLPHNDDVTKPRALNTLLDGLAELGVDKGVIKNKKVLNDLIEKEKGYRNGENTSENESKVESSPEREEEEIASASRRRRRKPLFIPFVKRRKQMMINFPPLSNLCIVLFMLLVFNKGFKSVSRVCF